MRAAVVRRTRVLGRVAMMVRKERRSMGSSASKLVSGSSVEAMVCGHPSTTYDGASVGGVMLSASTGLSSDASLEKTPSFSRGLNW
jgi:hypothetical protein